MNKSSSLSSWKSRSSLASQKSQASALQTSKSVGNALTEQATVKAHKITPSQAPGDTRKSEGGVIDNIKPKSTEETMKQPLKPSEEPIKGHASSTDNFEVPMPKEIKTAEANSTRIAFGCIKPINSDGLDNIDSIQHREGTDHLQVKGISS